MTAVDATARRRVSRQARRLAPSIREFLDGFDLDPDGVVDRTFPVDDPGRRFRLDQPNALAFAAARRGLERLLGSPPEFVLDADDEVVGLRLVITAAVRPAILFRDGRFLPPPQPWLALEGARTAIEHVARSVGRIQFVPAPDAPLTFGTAFVAGDGMLLTNRHVVMNFGDAGRSQLFQFSPERSPSFDVARDPDAPDTTDFRIRRVDVPVREDLDLAVIGVEPVGKPLPAPLSLASGPRPVPDDPSQPVPVYAVGYPGNDAALPTRVELLLGTDRSMKRLQPGALRPQPDGSLLRPAPPTFDHDCATLAGSSGSCVVDLASHQVLGLHAGQRLALGLSTAFALWELQDEPVLAGANFV